MITGFEEYTKELSLYESSVLLPAILLGMENKIGKSNAIKNCIAIKKMKELGYKISDARFRKIMHIIRVSGMIKGIVATSDGYYIAHNSTDYAYYIKSLDERIQHITNLRNALQKQYLEYINQIH